uniref:Helicase C-terminal domain-containing protein n=1 Tax=Panagrolaimus sp. ES5 TaxID=591445 RepID=A0AC34GEU4_9BILA
KAANHRCLIFSQYARNLEILADALSFRGYKYEHLDGSTKAEDRFQSIENFQSPGSDIFCFLISTKAGGQGLTLTAADTVIFLDSDYNPQNDLQAAARCHRIGQDKPVKVIRLLAEHTIDNVIRKRAEGKLKLSDFVLDDNSGSLSANVLREVLLSNLAELNKVPDCSVAYSTLLTDEYFIEQIGKTDENEHWINESIDQPAKKDDEEESAEVEFFPRSSPISKVSKEDENIFDKLKADLSNSDTVVTKAVRIAASGKKDSQSAADKEEQLKQRRDAAKARREALEKKKLEEKMKLWKDN